MAHVPYGYKIENGVAVIDEVRGEQIKALFQGYLEGVGLQPLAARTGISKFHAALAKLLEDRRYLGDGYYPALIDKMTFHKVQEERNRRVERLGRNKNSFSSAKEMESPFWHMLYCPECGSVFKRYSVKKKQQWRCSRYLVDGLVCCKGFEANEEELEDACVGMFGKIPACLDALKARPVQKKKQISKRVLELEELIASASDKAEKQRLLIARAEAVYDETVIDDFDFQTKKLLQALETVPTEFDGEFIKQIVRRMEVYKEGKIVFEFINGNKLRGEIRKNDRKKRVGHTGEAKIGASG